MLGGLRVCVCVRVCVCAYLCVCMCVHVFVYICVRVIPKVQHQVCCGMVPCCAAHLTAVHAVCAVACGGGGRGVHVSAAVVVRELVGRGRPRGRSSRRIARARQGDF